MKETCYTIKCSNFWGAMIEVFQVSNTLETWGFPKGFYIAINMTMLVIVVINYLAVVLVWSWKCTNCIYALDWSSIQCFRSNGKASNVNLVDNGKILFQVRYEYCDVINIRGVFIVGSMLQSQSLVAFNTLVMRYSLFIIDKDGNTLPKDKIIIGKMELESISLGSSTTL